MGERKRFRPHLRAFTLIELLAVVSIIVLLTAMLLPAFSRVRKQAQNVVCQARLRQLGQLASVYIQEHAKSPGFGRTFGQYGPRGGMSIWRLFSSTHALENPKLQLCPSATKPLPGKLTSFGDTFAAYTIMPRFNPVRRGSYAYSIWLDHTDDWRGPHWTTCDVKGAWNVPAFCDAAFEMIQPQHFDLPRLCEELYLWKDGVPVLPLEPNSMSSVCINRHNEATNMLFLDWSVRKVGLKELWTLRWNRQTDTSGPWTKAGGVLPGDWPEWMRKFKDY